jgi:hypothetical protein
VSVGLQELKKQEEQRRVEEEEHAAKEYRRSLRFQVRINCHGTTDT